jgi:hypothetical protein
MTAADIGIPIDTEAEKLTLGAITLLGTEALEAALSSDCEASDFYEERHRRIYKAAFDLSLKRIPVDLTTIKNLLEESGDLEKVGIEYLCALDSGIPTQINTASYAARVHETANRRRIVHSLNDTLKAAASGNGDFQKALDAHHRFLSGLRGPNESENQFEAVAEDHFRLTLPQFGIVLDIDRLRREHNELIGELQVKCSLPGVRTYDGVLSVADFNLSGARARTDRAKLLAERAGAKELDWHGFLEELCQRVLSAERAGQPAIDLRTLERPGADDTIRIERLSLPRRHPAILFGDGGACKSYLALYLAGRLAEQGFNVALLDWELAGEDHRDRLERLFGPVMPKIQYARCERPLVYEADRLSRIVRDRHIDYAVFDSVAFACDGPPESAETAGKYFRACRQIGIGGLHIAHVTKGEAGDQKPFGSVFFHNGARSTWYVKLAEESPNGEILELGIFARKSNLGRLPQPTGYRIQFSEERTIFSSSEPADTPDLAAKMTIRQRMTHLLRQGSMTIQEIAEALDADPESVRRSAVRNKTVFRVYQGGKVSLLQRDTESGQYVRRTVNDRVSGMETS